MEESFELLLGRQMCLFFIFLSVRGVGPVPSSLYSISYNHNKSRIILGN